MPGRHRYDLCKKALERQPMLITTQQDRDLYDWDENRFRLGYAGLVVACPLQVYSIYQYSLNPAKNFRWSMRGSVISLTALMNFGYSIYKRSQVEQNLFEKYLGNVTIDGLK